MSRKLIVYFLPLILVSCGADPKTPTETNTSAMDSKSVQAAVPYTGQWISAEYLDKIQKHKSPRQAQEGSKDCFIQIPASTLVPTFMVHNFHEAGPDLVVIKEKDSYQLWEKQLEGLTKMAYTMTLVSNDTLRLGEKNFVRIHPSVQEKEARILEEILFRGVYTMEDGQKVEFKNNGEIQGWDRYTRYTPVIDYFDAGLQIDQLGLGNSNEKLDYFGFKFKNNTLILYDIKCKTFDRQENRCVEVDFGKEAYELSILHPQ